MPLTTAGTSLSYCKVTCPMNQMNDIHDSPCWKEAYSNQGMFCGDFRGVAFSLCVDGVNPVSKEFPTRCGQLC